MDVVTFIFFLINYSFLIFIRVYLDSLRYENVRVSPFDVFTQPQDLYIYSSETYTHNIYVITSQKSLCVLADKHLQHHNYLQRVRTRICVKRNARDAFGFWAHCRGAVRAGAAAGEELPRHAARARDRHAEQGVRARHRQHVPPAQQLLQGIASFS